MIWINIVKRNEGARVCLNRAADSMKEYIGGLNIAVKEALLLMQVCEVDQREEQGESEIFRVVDGSHVSVDRPHSRVVDKMIILDY